RDVADSALVEVDVIVFVDVDVIVLEDIGAPYPFRCVERVTPEKAFGEDSPSTGLASVETRGSDASKSRRMEPGWSRRLHATGLRRRGSVRGARGFPCGVAVRGGGARSAGVVPSLRCGTPPA